MGKREEAEGSGREAMGRGGEAAAGAPLLGVREPRAEQVAPLDWKRAI